MKRLLQKYRRQKLFVPPRSRLNGLPFEMKLAILHEIPDLPSLQSLIRASASYRRVYTSASHSILSGVLLRDVYPDLLFDVLSMADVMKLAHDCKPHAPELKRFVERCKTNSKAPLAIERLDLGTLEMLADVHIAVRHATNQFCRSTLSNHPMTGESIANYSPLSHSETRRIHRAFHRYELFCTLFHEPDSSMAGTRGDGDMVPGLDRPGRGSMLSQTKSFLFLALFKAWEVEEIACVRDYIIRRYKALIEQCEPELQKQCFRNVVPWLFLDALSRTDLETWNHNIKACQEQYLSLGLRFFNRVSEASPGKRFDMLRDNIRVIDCFLSKALTKEPPGFSIMNDFYGTLIDEAELQKINEDLDSRPNAAWAWSNDYWDESWYFRAETEDLRRWGYVMWDKERLDDWRVLDEEKRLKGRYRRRLLNDW